MSEKRKCFIVNGAAGVNGSRVVALLESGYAGASLAAGIDPAGGRYAASPELLEPSAVAECDCVIDFSHHSATRSLLEFCIGHGLPVIVATTGQTPEEEVLIATAGTKIPVFRSANMSVGVAFLADIARRAAVAYPDADIEIVERHHNRKLDAPSGTALMLAQQMEAARSCGVTVCGRAGQGKREKGEIGISSVRAGNYIGEHEIIIHTGGEILTLSHSAVAPDLFPRGAVDIAVWLAGKPVGYYGMKEYISENGND